MTSRRERKNPGFFLDREGGGVGGGGWGGGGGEGGGGVGGGAGGCYPRRLHKSTPILEVSVI